MNLSIRSKLALVALSLYAVLPHQALSAETADLGKDAAYQVCAKMSMPGHREDCRKIVSASRTFTVQAVQLCGSFDFVPYINDCLTVIRDKHYSQSEVELCDKETIDRHKIECLGNVGGNPGGGGYLPPEASYGIRSAIRSIEMGDGYRAREILKDILYRFGERP